MTARPGTSPHRSAMLSVLTWVAATITALSLLHAPPSDGFRPAAAVTSAFVADADTTVAAAAPDRNYGTSGRLQSDGVPLEETLIRFTVSGISGTVSDVKLRLYVHDGSIDGPAVFRTGTGWAEGTVTWRTKPARSPAIIADAGAVSAAAYLELDMTAAVTGNGSYSFALASASRDATEFSSRSAPNPPRLVVTSAEVPASPTPVPSPTPTALPTARPSSSPAAPGTVMASAETDAVPHSGDAADDAAIWIHPTDTSRSTIIGTDKQGGLAVYDLAGNQLHYHPVGNVNNVDLRYNFPLAGERVTLVTASNRSTNSIGIYRVDVATRGLVNVAERLITTSPEPYGLCMYHSPVSGKYFVVSNTNAGDVRQWELSGRATGTVDATQVRSFDAGGITEGCVADDELGHLYIGEEDVAIWKYGAEPNAGSGRTQVDSVGGGRLDADVEGLTLYHAGPAGGGYLIASSQGTDEFAIYERGGTNAYIATFRIGAGVVDRVSGTDGIDVTNAALGSAFPRGAFVAQDNTNDDGNQNFKLVPWDSIARSASPALAVDTSWDPRAIGR